MKIFQNSLTYRNASDNFHNHISLIWKNFVHKFASKENHNRSRHEDSWQAKAIRITFIHIKALSICTKNRSDEGGNERAGVNGEIKQGEEESDLLCLFGQFKLFSAKSCNTRFNSSATKCDEKETKES